MTETEQSIIKRRKQRPAITALSSAMVLMYYSPTHRQYGLDDIRRLLLPPIQLRQYIIFRDRDCPVGFITWAWLTDEVESSFHTRTKKIEPSDWTSGNNLWCIDFVAPFGHAKSIATLLRQEIFTTSIAKAQRLRKDGSGLRVITLRGVNYAPS